MQSLIAEMGSHRLRNTPWRKSDQAHNNLGRIGLGLALAAWQIALHRRYTTRGVALAPAPGLNAVDTPQSANLVIVQSSAPSTTIPARRAKRTSTVFPAK